MTTFLLWAIGLYWLACGWQLHRAVGVFPNDPELYAPNLDAWESPRWRGWLVQLVFGYALGPLLALVALRITTEESRAGLIVAARRRRGEKEAQMSADEPPRFKHDCRDCTYLGRYEEYDLYHCLEFDSRPTVVARYGDEGPDYGSGMIFADQGAVPELVEAKRRAVERGLPVTPKEVS
jgi:hypothetical protein